MGVTLGKKQLNKGRISLYLNYSHNGKRRKEYLGIILEPPVTPEARAENKNKILIAKQIRAKKELEFLSVEYALNKTAETFEDILPEAPSNGPDFFRINKCVEKKLISHNPTNGIRLSQFDEVTKEILTLKEIQKLAVTSCPNNEVKRAFLFSCYCGLRWCDVYQLRYKDVDFPARRLTIIQQKVQTHSKSAILHLNLNHTALKLLQKCNGDREDLVFSLPSYSYTIRILRKWVIDANIRKHITFHCARHSFITNIMANGANIKTAASLAGHSTTRHTEKYVHIIDELKQKAVDSLPDLTINY